VAREVREDAADPAAGLTVLFEFEGTLHDGAGNAGGGFDAGARIKLLAVEFGEEGFGVEGIALADAAVHEELDDALGFGSVVEVIAEEAVSIGEEAILTEEMGESDAA